ncbi:MAG: HigA family addiction module antidote protein, partial [Thermoguttaceae bacterium]|nr:HigA family addiction module antidote protein [Thermoguttaceae bacterium]
MDKKQYYALEPNYAVPPGEILADALEMRGISQARFARSIGVSTNTMSRLIRGESALTSDMALRIERALDIPASLWLNAEANYQLCKKRREESEALEKRRDLLNRPPIVEAIKRKYLEPNVNALLRFFRLQSPESFDNIDSNPSFALRCSDRANRDPLALATWLQMGTIEAEKIQIALYNERAFRASLDEV